MSQSVNVITFVLHSPRGSFAEPRGGVLVHADRHTCAAVNHQGMGQTGQLPGALSGSGRAEREQKPRRKSCSAQ
ncbi:hypothetical protein Pyn_00518 [Prunus yedoensis var. nudiflora]|uniref:Uncharacterized protein n=1 Tax=Prunus yedoensis var. nudiflora TaxID=2094558 RepID=A0A314YH77_PRUYE|nr:hypothetical protein Pyn_00518 [Prunus yedoensis var. nudiflora]